MFGSEKGLYICVSKDPCEFFVVSRFNLCLGAVEELSKEVGTVLANKMALEEAFDVDQPEHVKALQAYLEANARELKVEEVAASAKFVSCKLYDVTQALAEVANAANINISSLLGGQFFSKLCY